MKRERYWRLRSKIISVIWKSGRAGRVAGKEKGQDYTITRGIERWEDTKMINVQLYKRENKKKKLGDLAEMRWTPKVTQTEVIKFYSLHRSILV